MQYLKFNEEAMTGDMKEASVKEIKKVCLQCKDCGLYKTRTNVVFSDGMASAPIMLIGEAPGAEEDASGIPFVGKAGRLLNELLEESGISRKENMYICNTLKCRPPENRVPTDEEKELCEQYLNAQINIVRPKVIVLCGSTAAKSFIKDDIRISQIRGKWFNILDNIKTTVIFHPSYLLRNHSLEENSPRSLTKKDLLAIKKAAIG